MKLLIITQKVDENDDVLGFFHRWIEEFAKHCERVTVICLYEGDHHLPENVKVLSLGKEKYFRGACDGERSFLEEKFFSKITYIYRFYRYIWSELRNYDSVFVHMNQMYVILGAVLWRLLGKKIGLWYAHGYVSFSLRIAEKLSDIIFTSTTSGFRLKSKKIRIVGQGIDTEFFTPFKKNTGNDILKIISIGRISPVKNYETLIKAVDVLVKTGIRLVVVVVGGVGLSEQEQYFDDLKKEVKSKGLGDVIHFIGAVPNKEIVALLQKSDLFLNTSFTGSLDKAILEAMAVGIPVVTCNEAMLEVWSGLKSDLMFTKGDKEELAVKIKNITNMSSSNRDSLGNQLRDIVIKDHNVDSFIDGIINFYESLYISQ